MFRYVKVKILICMVLAVNLFLTPNAYAVNFNALKRKLNNDNLTDVQKEAIWEGTYEDTYVSGSGIVTDIKPATFTDGAYVYLKSEESLLTYDISLEFPDKKKVLHLRKGQRVRFEGKAAYVHYFMGFSVTFKDVIIK